MINSQIQNENNFMKKQIPLSILKIKDLNLKESQQIFQKKKKNKNQKNRFIWKPRCCLNKNKKRKWKNMNNKFWKQKKKILNPNLNHLKFFKDQKCHKLNKIKRMMTTKLSMIMKFLSYYKKT